MKKPDQYSHKQKAFNFVFNFVNQIVNNPKLWQRAFNVLKIYVSYSIKAKELSAQHTQASQHFTGAHAFGTGDNLNSTLVMNNTQSNVELVCKSQSRSNGITCNPFIMPGIISKKSEKPLNRTCANVKRKAADELTCPQPKSKLLFKIRAKANQLADSGLSVNNFFGRKDKASLQKAKNNESKCPQRKPNLGFERKIRF